MNERRRLWFINWPLIGVSIALLAFGSIMVQAATSVMKGGAGLYQRQLLGIAIGMDKHLPGAFTADPRLYACPSWYGEVGQFITTKFFGMKINKYMDDYGISHATLAKVAAKNYRNGVFHRPSYFKL